ncbi:MAG: 3-hydroxyacyl-CoA dehydrogenase family protein, partial [Brachybacterium sp.]
NCFVTFENAFGDRLATPSLLTDSVAADRKGVKNGKGLLGDYDEDTAAELVAYRNKAYAKMSQLLAELGPAPKPTPKND